MNVKGKIKLIMDAVVFDSGFTKQEIVITTDEKYPQDVKVEFLKDNVKLLLNYKAGDNVDVAINIQGNEFNGKYYVNLTGWRIAVNNSNAPENVPEPAKPVEDSFDAEDVDSF